MAHLKRLNAPTTWSLRKKGITFIAKPSAGPHKQQRALTLNIILKDMLRLSTDTRESKLILKQKNILVNGHARKDHRFPAGIMDVISSPALKQAYIILFSEKGKLILHPWSATKGRLCKISGKHILPKKKLQLNFHDGTNMIVDKDAYKVGDTVIVEQKKIIKHFKFEKGALVYLIGGKNTGKTGIVSDIKTFKGTERDRIILHIKDQPLETLKDYAFVIGEPFQ